MYRRNISVDIDTVRINYIEPVNSSKEQKPVPAFQACEIIELVTLQSVFHIKIPDIPCFGIYHAYSSVGTYPYIPSAVIEQSVCNIAGKTCFFIYYSKIILSIIVFAYASAL